MFESHDQPDMGAWEFGFLCAGMQLAPAISAMNYKTLIKPYFLTS